jgi:hypothetical protein
MESRKKCAVNVRPFTITNLDGINPQSFNSIIKAAKVIECISRRLKTIIAKG